MSPRPRSWPQLPESPISPGISARPAQFSETLKQRLQDGLSPDLSLDLVLNELVVAATTATHATAAAVGLVRGEELVCRATTGDHAPDLGIPLSAHTGLSGACVRSRTPQYCADTENDERVDSAVSRHLGIRSILVVPILDDERVVGIIEIFSPEPGVFSESDEARLRAFALEALTLRRLAAELTQRPPHKLERFSSSSNDREISPATAAAVVPIDDSELGRSENAQLPTPVPPGTWREISFADAIGPSVRTRTDIWTIILTTLVLTSTLALVLLIGFRTGWLGSVAHRSPAEQAAPRPDRPGESAASIPAVPKSTPTRASAATPFSSPVAPNGLIIYEAGKVVFRAAPKPTTEGKSKTTLMNNAGTPVVWLAPAVAELRLLQRVEPEYPADARAAHLSGDVTLEVLVRDDGAVESTRTLNGAPLLAEAAAAAVRHWLYQPYRLQGRPTEFQTEVTLTFSLPQ